MPKKKRPSQNCGAKLQPAKEDEPSWSWVLRDVSAFWCWVPGIPKGMKWPVLHDGMEKDIFNVHVLSDNMSMSVTARDLLPLSDDFEERVEIGRKALRKRPDTRKCFEDDLLEAKRRFENSIGEGHIPESEQRAEVPVPSEQSAEVPLPSEQSAEVPVPSEQSAEVPVPSEQRRGVHVPESKQTAEVPVPSKQSAEVPVPSEQSTEVHVPESKQTAEVPVPSKQSAEIPVPSEQSTEVHVPESKQTAEVPVPSKQSAEVPVPSEQSTEAHVTESKQTAEVPVPSKQSAEVPVPSQPSTDIPVPKSEQRADIPVPESEQRAAVSLPESERGAEVPVPGYQQSADVPEPESQQKAGIPLAELEQCAEVYIPVSQQKSGVHLPESEQSTDLHVPGSEVHVPESEQSTDLHLPGSEVHVPESELSTDLHEPGSEQNADVPLPESEQRADINIPESEQRADVPVPSEQSAEVPVPSEQSAEVPVPSEQSTEVPVPSEQSTEVHVPESKQTAEVPVPSKQSAEIPVPSEQSTEVHVPSEQSTEVPVPSEQSTEAHVPESKQTVEVPVPSKQSAEVPVPSEQSTEAHVPESKQTAEVPVPSKQSAEVPVPSEQSTEVHVPESKQTAEVPVPSKQSAEVPVPSEQSTEVHVPESQPSTDIPVPKSEQRADIPVPESEQRAAVSLPESERGAEVPVPGYQQSADVPEPESQQKAGIPLAELEQCAEVYIPVSQQKSGVHLPESEQSTDLHLPGSEVHVPESELSTDLHEPGSEQNADVPLPESEQRADINIPEFEQRADVPVPSEQSAEVPVPSEQSAEVPVPSEQSAEVPVPSEQSTEVHVPESKQTAEVPVPSKQSAEVPVPSEQSAEVPVPSEQSAEVPVPSEQSAEVHVPSEQSTEAHVPESKQTAEVPVPSKHSAEVPVPSEQSTEVHVPESKQTAEVPVPSKQSAEVPVPSEQSAEVHVPESQPSTDVPVPEFEQSTESHSVPSKDRKKRKRKNSTPVSKPVLNLKRLRKNRKMDDAEYVQSTEVHVLDSKQSTDVHVPEQSTEVNASQRSTGIHIPESGEESADVHVPYLNRHKRMRKNRKMASKWEQEAESDSEVHEDSSTDRNYKLPSDLHSSSSDESATRRKRTKTKRVEISKSDTKHSSKKRKKVCDNEQELFEVIEDSYPDSESSSDSDEESHAEEIVQCCEEAPRKELLLDENGNDESEDMDPDYDLSYENLKYAADFPQIYTIGIREDFTDRRGNKKKRGRVFNLRHPCPFGCKERFRNFGQHIFSSVHKQEPRMKVFTDKDTKKERLKKILLLRLEAENDLNLQTFKLKKGELMLARRPPNDKKFEVKDYGPCPSCKGWFLLLSLHRHQRKCPGRSSKRLKPIGELRVTSDAIAGRLCMDASQPLKDEVFPIMINDSVGKLAKQDPLIVSLGNFAMERNIGNKAMRRYYTSNIMRLVAKLLQHIRALQEDDSLKELPLWDYIKPKHYSDVVHAALLCCGPDPADGETLASPSNALKLGYDIQRLAEMKQATAMLQHDGESARKEAKHFLFMKRTSSWKNKVTKLARVILSERRSNKKITLPLAEDIVTLAKFLVSNVRTLTKVPEDYKDYKRHIMLCLARLITYNRRRPGEVQGLRLTQYEHRTKGLEGLDENLAGKLTATEKQLVVSQEVVEIRGKRDKRVPLIIPPECRKAMSIMTDKDVREKFGVGESPFVFASQGGGIIRGYYAVHVACEEAGLLAPENMNATKLRKYMACVTQVLDMDRQDMTHILTHMGHTWDVHRDFYRQYSPVIERLDVAKVLLIQDQNLVGENRKKKLANIGVEQLRQVEFKELVENEEGPPLPLDETYQPHPYGAEVDEEMFQCDGTDLGVKKRKSPKSVERHTWTDEEKEELKVLFPSSFKKKKLPFLTDVLNAQTQSKANGGSVWRNSASSIKNVVARMIAK